VREAYASSVAPRAQRLAVVVNPTKLDDPDLRARLTDQAEQAGWQVVGWHETSQDDPGRSAAQAALADSPDVVVAFGGDGTVRLVAGEVAESPAALGIIPAGTGNLLARNLGLPLDDPAAALEVILAGHTRAIDIGHVQFDDGDLEPFCVIAGAGLDADTVNNAPEEMKKRFRVIAYVVSGLRSLAQRGFHARLVTDQEAESRRQHARSVMICNCATLHGGISLVPEAEPDDGLLDGLVVAPTGVFGWIATLTDLVTHHRRGHGPLAHRVGTRVEADLDRPVAAQVDGDDAGTCRTITAHVQAGALRVLVVREETA